MRVALFTETFLPKVDGIVNTLCHVLDYLAEREHASLLFAPQGSARRYARTAVVTLPAVPWPSYPEFKIAWPLTDVRPWLESFQPDVVHLVNPVFVGLAGLRAARQLPRVTQAELKANGFRRVRVWSRGVDTVQYDPQRRSSEWRQRLSGGQPDAPILLYVGRLAPEKRIEWLRPVLNAMPDARLAIVGDGPSRSALEQLFTGTPTTFTGYLRGDDLAQAYASADVFVFPAANETLGKVVLEAMASGLPVITPRSGGLLDHVQDGQQGLLFEPESPTEMVEATRRLVHNPAYARELSAAGWRYAEMHTWADTLGGLLRDYASIIARQDRRKRTRLPASLRRHGAAI